MTNLSLNFSFLTPLIFLLCYTSISKAQNNSLCTPSSCGDINISYPFRLTDPTNCGHFDPIFALECQNNRTLLHANSRTYHAQTITYTNFSIRLSDPGLNSQNYSSCPIYPYTYNDLYLSYMSYSYTNSITITFINCLSPVTNNPLYITNPFCGNTSAIASNSSRVYSYVTVGNVLVSDFEEFCTFDTTAEVSSRSILGGDKSNLSYSDVHDLMAYGFEMSWYRVFCDECNERNGDCDLEDDKVRCRYSCYEIVSLPPDSLGCKLVIYGLYLYYVAWAIGAIIALRFVIGVPFLIGFVMHKWKKRRSSMQESEIIEELVRHQVNFMPINYAYGEIKKMTKNFKSKLGDTVFKGTLRTGPSVAVKMLINSSASDKEFISHVSKLSKISHPNVVKIIGFCIKGTKRALVCEFMQCGSLEKHVFLQERMNPTLKYEDMFKICLGLARGIECLHGDEIYHLGIKPRNVLLDEEFNPKISDCGLEKFYSSDDQKAEAVNRGKGKMRFIAPELLYKRNIGEISCKADVYSFGMLVLEMVARIKYVDKLGQVYFPSWIYKQLSEGKEMEIMDANEEEKMVVKKMIVVTLWCIQIRPCDRPLMSEVVVMLQGGIEMLHLPPMAFQGAMDDDDDIKS